MLTKPHEIDGKTFKEWPFQESLCASNIREDGPFGGVAFTDAAYSNKHYTNSLRGVHTEEPRGGTL